MTRFKISKGQKVPMTAEEEAMHDADIVNRRATAPQRKLDEIKQIRLGKLKETDYMGFDDVTMPENIKTWRQSLRDIPQNNTTEEQYDLILAKVDGNLTNEIWSKP